MALNIEDLQPPALFVPFPSAFTNYRPSAEVEADKRSINPDAYDAIARELGRRSAAIAKYHSELNQGE